MDGPQNEFKQINILEEAFVKGKKSGGPPIAPIIPTVTCKLFDKEIVDDYGWIKGKNNAKALKYVEEENAYTERSMKHLSKLQNSLFNDMVAVVSTNESKSPYKQIDDYYYYIRNEEEQEYPIHCRKFDSLDNEEQVILDENKEAEGEDFFSMGPFEVSYDHNFLVYGIDSKGDEEFSLRFRNLVTLEWLDDEIVGCGWTVRWAADNRTVLYTKLDSSGRSCKLYSHTLGLNAIDGSDDELLLFEKDPRFVVQIATTNNRKYFLMYINGQITNEIHYMPTDNLYTGFQPITLRQRGVRSSVQAHGSYFYIHTNAGNSPNFRVMRSLIVDIQNKENWDEVLPHRLDVFVERIELFRHHFVAWEWENGVQKIRVQDLSDNEVHYVAIPEALYAVWPGEIRDKDDTLEDEYFGSNVLRFTYTSFLQPPILYEYDMDRRRKKKATEPKILGFNKEHYHQKRIFAPARDGSLIPISLVYKISLRAPAGGNPLLMYAYGAYGGFMLPTFSPDILVLLDRGFIYSIAHVRGDADMGSHWYEQGKFLNKKNTFLDVIDCAEYLIQEGYTTPQKLAISGRSAGGLTVTAVTNMRPDLFKVVIAPVPFVDVIGSMIDPNVPWTAYEWEEWGNPNEEEFFHYMLSYSPYHNIQAKDYPNMLFISGLNDSRVSFSEPTKFVAKLRKFKTDNNMLLLKTYLAGHMGSPGRYASLEERAFIYAFIIDRLDVNPIPAIVKPLLQVISPVAVTPPKLLAMLQAYQVTAILYAALDLGLFNAMHEQPNFKATCSELAERLGIKTRGLKRLLEALVAVGILASEEEGIYSLTNIAVTHLVSGLPGYVGDLRFTLASEEQWDAMRRLADVIKGKSPTITKSTNVSHDVAFRQHVSVVMSAALSTWEKRKKRLIVLDLCCGNGFLGFNMAQRNSNAIVYSMDRSSTLGTSKKFAEDMKISERIHFHPIEYSESGDDFRNVDLLGPYDLIIVGGNILNSFGRENASSLLQQIGDVLQDTGRVVFLEMISGLDAAPEAMLRSVTMLVTQSKGKVHSIDWFNELLEEGGFGPPYVHNLDPFYEKLMVSSRNIITHKKRIDVGRVTT